MEETFRQKLAQIVQIEKEGNNKYSVAYDWFMLVVIGLSLIPLMVENDNTPFLKCIEWVTVVVFIIDFGLRCYAAPAMKRFKGKSFLDVTLLLLWEL